MERSQRGADGEEVRAVPPVGRRLVHQLEVGLMDHGGGVEGVVAGSAAAVAGGGAAELVVDQGDDLVEGPGHAGPERFQHAVEGLGGGVGHAAAP